MYAAFARSAMTAAEEEEEEEEATAEAVTLIAAASDDDEDEEEAIAAVALAKVLEKKDLNIKVPPRQVRTFRLKNNKSGS
jgi:hypothetical protein